MRPDEFADQVVIVTGAASGQGAAEARLFASLGASVVVADIADGSHIAAEIGDKAAFVRHDITSVDDWSNVVAFATQRFGGVDVLVNNAGLWDDSQLFETSPARFEQLVHVNFVSAFLGMRAVIDAMELRGGGAIVNIASGAAWRGASLGGAYTAAKWGLRGLSRSAAIELARRNIRVNTVLPGYIDTPMTAGNAQALVDSMVAVTPLQRVGHPAEVAAVVAFVASSDGNFMVGAEIAVDGGRHA